MPQEPLNAPVIRATADWFAAQLSSATAEQIRRFADALDAELLARLADGGNPNDVGLSGYYSAANKMGGFQLHADMNVRDDPDRSCEHNQVLTAAAEAAGVDYIAIPRYASAWVMPPFVAATLEQYGEPQLMWRHPSMPLPLCEADNEISDAYPNMTSGDVKVDHLADAPHKRCTLTVFHEGRHNFQQRLGTLG